MRSITKTPLPGIESFSIDADGVLTLSNSLLSMELQELWNEGIPTFLSRGYTCSSADSYVTDILETHDGRLRNQPNAVNNEQCTRPQLSDVATGSNVDSASIISFSESTTWALCFHID